MMTIPFRAAIMLAFSSLFLVPVGALAQDADRTLDDIYAEWLEAFNSGDPDRIVRFYSNNTSDPNVMFLQDMAANTCGFDPVRIEARTATTLNALLVERCNPALHRLEIELGETPEDPLRKLVFRPFALPMESAVNATQSMVDRMSDQEQFAGTILIERGGTEMLLESWGTRLLGGNEAITPDTPFFYGSVGKMFTAVATLQLLERGIVGFEDTIADYLPDYPNKEMAQVTVRQLLQHRGGTGDIGMLGRDDGEAREKVRTIADIIALNGDRAPSFPPGSEAAYSNYGMVLLGAIIEAASGQDYYDYVSENVFAPANMTNTGFPTLEELDGIAMGSTTFYGQETELHSSLEVLPWRGSPAGGGVSSARDLLSFMHALRDGVLINPETLELATTAGDTPWYGMGFFASTQPNRIWGHAGQAHGNDVSVYYYADFDTYFICTSSRDFGCNRPVNYWWLFLSGSEE